MNANKMYSYIKSEYNNATSALVETNYWFCYVAHLVFIDDWTSRKTTFASGKFILFQVRSDYPTNLLSANLFIINSWFEIIFLSQFTA